jgi:hypothetical protein
MLLCANNFDEFFFHDLILTDFEFEQVIAIFFRLCEEASAGEAIQQNNGLLRPPTPPRKDAEKY